MWLKAAPDAWPASNRLRDKEWYASLVLLLLLLVYICSQTDRQMLAVIISTDLQCNLTALPAANTSADCIAFNDAESGFLTGIGFTAIYSLAGVPLGRLADVKNRVAIIAVGLSTWSLMTVATSFVETYWELALVRVGLGISEAALAPCALSMIGDIFVAEQRATASSIYLLAVYFGGGMGYLTGVLAHNTSWRRAFQIIGAPGGLLLVLLLALARDPQRGASEKASAALADQFGDADDADQLPPASASTALEVGRSQKDRTTSVASLDGRVIFGSSSEIASPAQPSVYATLVRIWKCKSFVYICLATSFRNFAGYALGGFLPNFYKRVFLLDADEYGLILAFVVPVGGGIGVYIAGKISDHLSTKRADGKAIVAIVSQFLAAPLLVAALMVEDYRASFALLFFEYIIAEMWIGSSAAMLQDVCQPDIRATASAVYLMTNSIVGGCGPLFVGFLNDGALMDRYGRSAVRYGLLYTVPASYVLSAVAYMGVAYYLRTEFGWQRAPSAKRATYTSVDVSDDLPSDDTTGLIAK